LSGKWAEKPAFQWQTVYKGKINLGAIFGAVCVRARWPGRPQKRVKRPRAMLFCSRSPIY